MLVILPEVFTLVSAETVWRDVQAGILQLDFSDVDVKHQASDLPSPGFRQYL